MSVKAMSWVWEECQHNNAKLLMMLAIADSCNDEGVCYPGVQRLADKVRVTKQRAQAIIRDLKKSGELAVVIGIGTDTNHGPTNRYFLNGYRKSIGLQTVASTETPTLTDEEKAELGAKIKAAKDAKKEAENTGGIESDTPSKEDRGIESDTSRGIESNTPGGIESDTQTVSGNHQENRENKRARETQPFTVMPNKNEFDQFRVKTFPIRQYSDGKPIEPMIGGVFHAECINIFKAWQDAMSKYGISSDDDPATIWDENKRRIMQLAANRRTPEQVRAYVLSKYEQGDQWHKNNKAPVTIKNIVDGIAVFIDTQPKPQASLPDIELPPADVDEGVVVPNMEPEDISA